MKGVILAGGLGTRLSPLTKVTNKHLLPVFNKPMIFYPIECLQAAGIRDILVVTGGNSAGDFLKLLGNGSDFGVNLFYAYQVGEGGIAVALALAERFVASDRIIVMLGDNIFENSIADAVAAFAEQERGARILLKAIDDPRRFGVAEMQGDLVVGIEEKPDDPKSNLAVTGLYMYDNSVFDIIRTLEPSKRGEFEITDVNNVYIERREMAYNVIEGWWSDAGTFESLARASELVRDTGSNKPV